MSKVFIVPADLDNAWYIGDEEEGGYMNVGMGPGGWYLTVTIDASSFIHTVEQDDGPYESEVAATRAGTDMLIEWYWSNVDYGPTPFDLVSQELAEFIDAYWLEANDGR